MRQKIACVIPARLGSMRFPQKVLSVLKGKPLLQWVYEAASPLFETCVFAVDDEIVAELVAGFGAPYVMTSKDCQSGTMRLIEVRKQGKIKADIWVNWQADEPLIHQEMIDDLLQSCDDPCQDVWTLKHRLEGDPNDPHTVKVVTDGRGKALYFSRSPIPYSKEKVEYYKHVGLYAYSDRALAIIEQLASCPLEKAESLEQLRFLSGGLHIQVHETKHETQGIDLPEHLAKLEGILSLTPRPITGKMEES
ncbi:MAG: 3-deoxy-manno-octulosonate cytidylyltransferase [Chlamydiia bacterium]|nr:3-deoxy-manno-octulosonate cytidylyltransferase [Chlamydiia bacterium]